MNEEEPRLIERAQRSADGRQNRSNAMVTLGVVLFLVAGAILKANPEGATGAILFAVLGAGLIVGGLVIRR